MFKAITIYINQTIEFTNKNYYKKGKLAYFWLIDSYQSLFYILNNSVIYFNIFSDQKIFNILKKLLIYLFNYYLINSKLLLIIRFFLY